MSLHADDADAAAMMRSFRRLAARAERRGLVKTVGSYIFRARHVPVALLPPRGDAATARALTGKGGLTQGLERLSLLLRHRMEPAAYYDFCLFMPERLHRAGDFASHRQTVNVLAYLNRDKPVTLTTDKRRFAEHCARHGIAAPRHLGALAPGAPDPPDWPDALLAAARDGGIFVKPQHGMMGEGAGVLCANGTGLWTLRRAGEMITDVAWSEIRRVLMAGHEAYILQERLRNHPVLARFGDDALHTVRLVTFRRGDEFMPLTACLRIGGDGSITDNFAQGGAAAPLDLDTGRLGPGVRREAASLPGGIARLGPHGQELAGTVLPHHEAVAALGLAVHRSLPRFLSLGHDIAVTPSGPVVTETNAGWDAKLSQKAADRGIARMAGFVDAVLSESKRRGSA